MIKRLFQRVSINDGTCTLSSNGIYSGIIRNISLGGLFIESDLQLNVMDRVAINFKLTYNPKTIKINTDLKTINIDSDTKTININTNVIAVRIDNDGMALQFDKLNPKDFWDLQSFIQYANA